MLKLSFDLTELATFDERRSAFILEPGQYTLLLGKMYLMPHRAGR